MFKYQWVRKPDFTNIPDILEYNRYWEHRGWKISSKMNNRENIAVGIVPSGAKVIDMGCGNSMLPLKLKEKGVNITVSDVSHKVLDGYAEYGINGVLSDLEKLNSGVFSEKYDYMILFEVLEHLRYPEEVIKHLSKHTDNFLITVPNSAAYYYRFGLMLNGRFFTQWVHHPSEHLRYWSHIDFVDWLEAMGLKVEKTIATDGLTVKNMFPWLPNLWKNFFADRVMYHCSTKK